MNRLLNSLTCIVVLLIFALLFSFRAEAQTSTEFWFAPPEVTQGHAGSTPIYVRLAAGANPATVTVSMPANPSFHGGTPITVSLNAYESHTLTLDSMVNILETRPANTVLNTGLKISSTAPITAIYEVSPTNNPDIWALKGLNGLGTEFYTPFQNIWQNGNYTPTPYTSFDIVATQDNTTILIYPTSDLDGGQPAFQSFTITLNAGQTYSASVTNSNPALNPTGSQIISDKPIAVSIKDDSVNPTGYGCKDLNGDQLVPVNIVGNEYIVNKGALSAQEGGYIVATQNNTVISVDGTPVVTLFNGETYRVPIVNPLTYITGTKPFYLIHHSGFGCETGTALLPPLNCAGSEQVSFVRSTNEGFFINLLVLNGHQDAFVLDGNTSLIPASAFNPVPGTGGMWVGAQIQFTTAQISVGTAHLLTNTEEVFSMGLINGGSGSGTRFGYFSEFSAEIIVDAGPDQNVCANKVTQLAGNISGGATQGIWSTSGTGSFSDEYDLNAIYEPSLADLSGGTVTLTLTSISNCFPVEDQVVINYNPAPIVDAGAAIQACKNNPQVTLNGFVDIASGGLWSGGSGSFSPNPMNLNATYTPTATEINSGSVKLYLTSTGNGNCFSEKDSVMINFGEAPTVDAGVPQTLCANNSVAQLNGSVTIAGGVQWSGGTGAFSPSNQALAPTYTPSNADLINGSVTLTLTTTDNHGCIAVTDNVTLTYTPAPIVDAGSDRNDVCKNNAEVVLNGSVQNAGGGQWTGNGGTFSPDANTLNATYTPSLSELLAGTTTLTLKSTGNGNCTQVQDQMTINFSNPPVVDAGADGSVCSNNAAIHLNGSLSGANFGIWSGGNGSFSNTTALNATYTPTPAEISSGSVTLTLTSLDNGTCNSVSDDVTFTFTPSPTANAGPDQSICKNNAQVTLAGSVTISGGGVWTGGSGSFSPDNTTLNAVYTPTSSELANGSVTLTLKTTANGSCSEVSDQMTITFTDAPTANAGADKVLCANNADINLNGVVSVATGGTWSGGLGTYSPGANSLATVYSPTANEINSGSLTLTLTTSGNGNCTAVTDDIQITFTPAPVPEAGAPISVCSNNAQVSLGGSVSNAGGGTWSGGNGTFLPNANSLSALYNPTPAEIANGSLVLTLTSTGNGNCIPEEDVVNITFTPAPTANAGADVTVCANKPQVDLNGSVNLASGGVWSGGSGTFSPNNTTLGATYTPSNAEINAGFATLTLNTTGNGNCNAVSDQMTITITPAPVVDAGIGSEYCSNNPVITLNGSITGATGGTWTGGSGTFTPNPNDLNATYTPSQSEINSGSLTLTLKSTGNGNCLEVTDDVTYTFGPSPTADAGSDMTRCANNASATLSGVVTVATGGIWSGGNGTFSPGANSLNATYNPTSTEIANGSVTLTLTTTGNGDCNAVNDQVTISYTPAPVVNAGADKTVCANNPEVSLNGSVTGATGGIWSGGTGTFNPGASSLITSYTPSASEIAAGSVTLLLSSTGNGNCVAVTDQMTITITPAPVVDAGVGSEYCANNPVISLNGSVTGATGGTWTGGSGTFSPNANALNATYTPSQSEINAGTLTLTLKSTGNGSCLEVTDDVTYTFGPAPTADAGVDQSLCANNAEIELNGSVSIATGGIWSGGSGSFSPNATNLHTFYTPTATEIANGSVTLTLTTTGNGDCNPATDQITIVFTPAPTVNAGADKTVCANNAEVSLNGSVNGAGGGLWTGGAGTFNPGASVLNATYTPSADEIANGSVTLTLISTGNANCNAVTDQMNITITPPPTVDAGTGGELCANNAAITLNGSVSVAGGATWSGGNGTYSPNANTLNAVYTPSQSEINSGALTLTLTSTQNGGCSSVSDDVTYTFGDAPVVDAGTPISVCKNNPQVNLDGTISLASGGIWSGGAGTFLPNANFIDAIYNPTQAEIDAGSLILTLTTTGNGNCNAESDFVTITFTPAPTVNAGADKTVCANNPNVDLNGSINGASGAVWSGGSGTFSPDNTTLGATYTPSNAERANGTVTLTLTSTGNGNCLAVSDQMTITITPTPVVDAGSGSQLCSNNPAIDLNGSVTIATGGTWSGGSGTFAPNANDLNAVYTPSQSEINAGSLTLTLTSTGNGNCTAVTDDVTYTFGPSPTASAGADFSLCANNAVAELNGNVSVATGGTWSGGNGTFSPNTNSLHTFYTPTQAEIANGSVTLTLTTTGNGDCLPVTDEVTITFTPAPTANAGLDKTVCANNAEVTLNGSVNIASGGTWSGGNGSFTPDANTLNATYLPSADEINAGTVSLTLTTTGNANCMAVTDQMTITITPEPVVNAGVDASFCANNAQIQLSGTVTTATGGTWSGGSGTFTPNATDLNATYTPSQGEINTGIITLTLTSTGNGQCSAVSDDVTYTFTPAPVVNAGTDIELCSNNPMVSLSGSVTVATGGTWSGGNGSFSPSANALNATYTPTAAEVAAGQLILTLTSTGNSNCSPVSDDVKIIFKPGPSVNAGTDKTVCANNAEVNLNGSVSAATGGTWSGGSGTFSPDATVLNPSYMPSPAEIANGQAVLTLTSTGNGDCIAESDQMVITINPEPVVNAGIDFDVCSNNASFDLNGSVSNAGGGQWSGGLGTYTPDKNTLNANYTPTLPEIVSGSVKLILTSTGNAGCVAVTDTLTVSFTPSPTVDAGENITRCASSPQAALSGNYTVAGGAQWSGGNGAFVPNALAVNATYNPTAAEIANGSVKLYLTTISNGDCLAVKDSVTIQYDPQPTVEAGANLISCANNPIVTLNGSFTNVSVVQWSGGTGFFDPNNQSPNANYTPSNGEIANGMVTLTLTTVGTGACAPVTDNVNITINPAPVVNAGEDQTICANNNNVTLNGSVQFAGGGQWSGGNGTFIPNANALSATYQPSPAEVAAGFVTLTLKSTGNGACNQVTDQVTITFTPAPIADAGLDKTLCENNAAVELNGSFTVSEGANWSGGSGSFSPDNSTMNAIYTPSQTELNNGSVTLTLTTFGNGNCLPSSDQMTINFTPAPEVDAGEDYFVCVDDLTVPLSGVVTGPTSTGIWSTSGTGVFVPNASALNGTYQVSSQDSLAGVITLTLSSTNNGLCTAVTDEITVYISPAGTAYAGEDQSICKNNPTVQVQGVIGGAATSGTWLTSGSGVFTPSPNQPAATYIPSDADLQSGSVTLTFAVNSCNQATDGMVVTFTPSPVVAAGNDITICSSEDEVQLNGSVSGASATGQWTTSGSGQFVPDANAVNPIYQFSQADKDNQVIYLVLKATAIGNCIGVRDTLVLNIFPEGTADAGSDVTACDNNPEVQLHGVLTGADQALWTSSGTGTFAPSADSLNTTYVPSAGDLVNGSVNLILTGVNSCNNAQDFLTVTFTDGPEVTAGPDQSSCGDVMPFQISGTVSNAGGAHWSTTGTGTFQNANNLNTFYVASQADIDQGGVDIILTSTGNGNCFAVSDTLTLFISTGIQVDAGENRMACTDAGQIQLYGDITNGSSTGVWTTSGNGTFSPSPNNTNAVYNFTSEDIAAGTVTLTLTSTNNGICNESSDSFELTFGSAAYVFAGNTIYECQTTDLIQLTGVVSGESNTGIWTTAGDGTFFPNATTLNAYYEPGSEDIASGQVALTLTSTGNTLCSESSANVTVNLQALPVANAGNDQVICGEINSVQLLGNVSHATGGVWSTNGSGTFAPNDSVLTALYTPSEADSLSGSVTLTLTTIGNGACGADSDQMTISFSGAVTANAGPDQTICENTTSVALNGMVDGSPGFEWGTMGTGTFNPSTTDLATAYEPSATDVENGEVTLYLMASGTGNCPAQTDSLKLTFTDLPVITLASDVESCTTATEVTVNSNVTGTENVSWSSGGGGTFSPNATSENIVYSPTPGEIAAGQTTLTLTAIPVGACDPVSQNVIVHFRTPAVVHAGADIVACETSGEVVLAGEVSGESYGGVWSTNAFGSFSPSGSQLDAAYVFGANDVLIGSAKLILTSTNNGACQAVSDTMMITINRQPVVNAGNDDYVCKSSGTVALNGNVQFAEGMTWTSLGDGVFLPSADVADPDYIIGNSDADNGSVLLILTGSPVEGCSAVSDTTVININNPLQAGFMSSNACVGAPVQFTDQTQVFSGEISGWRWNFGNGNISNEKNPKYVYTEPGSQTVELIVGSTLGCNDTIVKVISVAEGPTAKFMVSENPAPVDFDIKFTDQSVGAEAWYWNMGDFMGYFETQDVTYAYTSGGDYEVTLVVEGPTGCTDSARVVLAVEGTIILPPRTPNTFSPNDDGLNDVYMVEGGPFTELDLRVYDAWGAEIFRSTDQNIGWDGTQGGKQAPTGVYVYTLKATTTAGDKYDYSGRINLLR